MSPSINRCVSMGLGQNPPFPDKTPKPPPAKTPFSKTPLWPKTPSTKKKNPPAKTPLRQKSPSCQKPPPGERVRIHVIITKN